MHSDRDVEVWVRVEPQNQIIRHIHSRRRHLYPPASQRGAHHTHHGSAPPVATPGSKEAARSFTPSAISVSFSVPAVKKSSAKQSSNNMRRIL